MILIDSSAWIEYLRGTHSPSNQQVESLIRDQHPFAICDPLVMEILAGAKDANHEIKLRRLLAMATHFDAMSGDYEVAATLYRTCRQRGRTVRKLIDCLIAAIAIRNDLRLLHCDTDFQVLSEFTELQVAGPEI